MAGWRAPAPDARDPAGEREEAGPGDFLHDLREAAERTDQARLSGDAIRITSAEQAEWDLTQAAIDEAAEKEPEAGE